MQRRGFNFEYLVSDETSTFSISGMPLADARPATRKVGDVLKPRRMARLLGH